ncbi:Pre-mrna-splicing factor clf1, partial [Thalictrum thalictroides]
MASMCKVKNKNPVSIQITAEHIIREARSHVDHGTAPPKAMIEDQFELDEYRLRKRKEFEKLITISHSPNVWMKYARWEESQRDFARSRSIWERALQHHLCYTNQNFWCRYATFEMSNRFLNHARNVWDRAVTLLPNVSQLWYKFIHMEEILGNIPGARQIFERWMSHSPDRQGWLSYIKFELRYKEIERARHIFDRFVQSHPQVDSYVRYAKFELNHGEVHRARQCYERAAETVISVDAAGCDNKDFDEAQRLFLSFAEFEEKCKETDRARCIYKYALDCLPKALTEDLYRRFIEFEKRYGDKESIENTLAVERRFQYEESVRKSPLDYDAWFDYIHLEMEFGTRNKDRIRDVYKKAISNLPPAEEKRYWKRYIYLWINYALYEELDAQDTDRTREVYRECLKLIPHNNFSFSKVWLLAAQFEIRQKNLDGARKILGNSIGRAASHKIFRKYIELELTLGNVDRCRA